MLVLICKSLAVKILLVDTILSFFFFFLIFFVILIFQGKPFCFASYHSFVQMNFFSRFLERKKLINLLNWQFAAIFDTEPCVSHANEVFDTLDENKRQIWKSQSEFILSFHLQVCQFQKRKYFNPFQKFPFAKSWKRVISRETSNWKAFEGKRSLGKEKKHPPIKKKKKKRENE